MKFSFRCCSRPSAARWPSAPRRRPCRHAQEDQGQRQRDQACASPPARMSSRSATASTPASTPTMAEKIACWATSRSSSAWPSSTSSTSRSRRRTASRWCRTARSTSSAARRPTTPRARRTCVRDHHLRRGGAHRGEGELGHHLDRPAQQERRHHHRHDLGADAAQARSAPTASTSRKCSARTTPTASCCSSRAAPTRS